MPSGPSSASSESETLSFSARTPSTSSSCSYEARHLTPRFVGRRIEAQRRTDAKLAANLGAWTRPRSTASRESGRIVGQDAVVLEPRVTVKLRPCGCCGAGPKELHRIGVWSSSRLSRDRNAAAPRVHALEYSAHRHSAREPHPAVAAFLVGIALRNVRRPSRSRLRRPGPVNLETLYRRREEWDVSGQLQRRVRWCGGCGSAPHAALQRQLPLPRNALAANPPLSVSDRQYTCWRLATISDKARENRVPSDPPM